MEKKLFKYYATRVVNTIVFRRTVSQLQKVKSRLYRPNTEFKLEQVSYTGGKAIGSMPYTQWQSHGGKVIAVNGCIKITREQFRALDPYMQKGL